MFKLSMQALTLKLHVIEEENGGVEGGQTDFLFSGETQAMEFPQVLAQEQ